MEIGAGVTKVDRSAWFGRMVVKQGWYHRWLFNTKATIFEKKKCVEKINQICFLLSNQPVFTKDKVIAYNSTAMAIKVIYSQWA